jgi:hypothetical protein
MATTFKKGDVVKVVATIPQGPVKAMRMDEDGNVQYLVEWTDSEGVKQERWFDEVQLASV